MKRLIWLLLAACVLCVPVRASELPPEAEAALPEEILSAAQRQGTLSGARDYLWTQLQSGLDGYRSEALRGAAELMLVSLLCAGAEGLGGALAPEARRVIPCVGVLAVTALSGGRLRAFIGLGAQTVEQLAAMAKLLLPALAAAVAAGGFAATASAWQMATLFACELLTDAMRSVLLPLTYCYIGMAAAGAILPESGLEQLAEGLRKGITWALCAAVGGFTAYLSLSNVLAGSADRTALKAARLAISGTVPVVGGLLSDAAESVLSGAQALRGSIGVLGICAILSVALSPLVRLGAHYVLYQLAAFVSGAVGTKEVQKLLQALSGAFALVLGMTAACALMLVVALLIAATMVVMT